MSTPRQDETRQWLRKSQRDLGAARRLMEGEAPYPDAAVFHCQQAVEKAAKAFLTHHDLPFPRTHDLTELVALAATEHPAFASWQPAAEKLTPYAVQFRYPGEVLEPTPGEAEQALREAEIFVEYVQHLIPGLE